MTPSPYVILPQGARQVSLDLSQVAEQIEEMAASLKAEEAERGQKINFALETLHKQAGQLDQLRQKVKSSRTTWLVAETPDRLDIHEPPPLLPQDFVVLASDGSHIDVDRHRSCHCFLINIGTVRLRYGKSPDAQLSSSPSLYSQGEDLVISSPSGNSYEPIEGALLGVKRTVEECRLLADAASSLEDSLPTLALLDGSLVLWTLAGQSNYPEYVSQALVNEGFLRYLEDMRKLSLVRQLAIAAYISFPRSTEVANVLRLAVCPHEPADCDRYCRGKDAERQCDSVAGVLDRAIFKRLLSPGERSAIFGSRSSIVEQRYGVHRAQFFYIKIDDEEVARVEIPLWVAQNGELMRLVHAVVWQQCCQGQGYPVALSEAHEKAVVTASDREQFWRLLERDIVLGSSAKSRSKKSRWI
jgi:hypothetical protein